MNTRRIIVIGVAACALLFSLSSRSEWWKFSKDDDTTQEAPVTEIFWEDLVPDDFVQPENPFISMSVEEIDRLMDGSPESNACLLYTSPSPRDATLSRMPSSA